MWDEMGGGGLKMCEQLLLFSQNCKDWVTLSDLKQQIFFNIHYKNLASGFKNFCRKKEIFKFTENLVGYCSNFYNHSYNLI